MECESTVFDIVPECKEGEANEKTQRSAKVRHHGYKIITVNLKVLNASYFGSTRTTDLIGLVWSGPHMEFVKCFTPVRYPKLWFLVY